MSKNQGEDQQSKYTGGSVLQQNKLTEILKIKTN